MKKYMYYSEILKVSSKWFSDKANAADLKKLDALINSRAEEGWEMVNYDYMATAFQVRGSFIVTFRKENDA